jgi:hypothetical protein
VSAEARSGRLFSTAFNGRHNKAFATTSATATRSARTAIKGPERCAMAKRPAAKTAENNTNAPTTVLCRVIIESYLGKGSVRCPEAQRTIPNFANGDRNFNRPAASTRPKHRGSEAGSGMSRLSAAGATTP